MTETQKRIQAYKKALPSMKERVLAVAMLFVVSISMMTSATFAWITLSRTPEVSGLATTIATNGSLEIALSDIDGLEPDATAVGDGGKAVTESNLTWGNLINLSDESYGLDYLTLRPAVLNSGSLLSSPLYSVAYGADGRISEVISDFAFTNFKIKDGAKAFFVPDNGTEYGVRAISSVTYSSVTGDAALVQLNTAVTRNFINARNKFADLYNNESYMTSVTQLAGIYLNYRIEDTDQDCGDYIEDLYLMLGEFGQTMEAVENALISTANLHHFIYCNKAENKGQVTYTEFTKEQLLNGTVKSTLAAEGVTISALDPYISMRTKFYGADGTSGVYGAISAIYEEWARIGDFVGWEEIRDHINVMANIYTTTVNGIEAQKISSDNITSLAGNSTNICVIHAGLIKDMDNLLGEPRLKATVKEIKVKVFVPISVKNIEVSTAAEDQLLVDDKEAAAASAAAGGLAATDATAADTYGMAIDFWVRTNAPNSLLMLEGELITQRVELKDAEGNPLLDSDGNPQYETVVVGYQGANRVWEEDDPGLPVLGPSVTQGSGSCYVFYPETPEDQAQSLELLSAMCVAFIDEEGTLLAQADMDTAHAIEESGRVLVPLQLRPKSIVTGTTTETDENGNEVEKDVYETSYHITELVQNEATRITAVVYMDGSRLSNSEVLASGSIKGQLNIQFGTTEDMVAMDDKVKEDFYQITLSADKSSFGSFDSNNKPKVNLSLTLNGMDASTIKGNFVSVINATQGARQPSFSFTKQEGSAWTAEVTFNGPGDYKLLSVQIDGVDYALNEDQIIEVEIAGTGVESVVCEDWDGANSYTYMTADSYYPLEMRLTTTGSTTPRKIQGVFAHENGQNVTINFTLTNNGWVGKANFTTSGTYTMTYVIIDGSYVPLAPAQYKTLTLNLGMQTRVFVSQPVNEAYRLLEEQLADAATEEEKADIQAQMDELLENLYVGDPDNSSDSLELVTTASGYQFLYDGSQDLLMNVSCIITDDQGNPMTGLSNVKLFYGVGSSIANRLGGGTMTWNANTGRYEGELELTKPGIYTFQMLSVGENNIYSATAAPRITAVSPDPIAYVGKSESYVTYVEDIRTNAERPMTVVLQDASSAEVWLTIENSDEGAPVQSATLEASLTYNYVDANGRKLYEYTVYAPTDGTWTITGMTVANVFYEDDDEYQQGVYFDGIPEGEGGTGVLDLSDRVAADNITTTYFTTVKFSASANPSAVPYEGQFMNVPSAIFDDMTITLTDYKDEALENVSVDLTYTWVDQQHFTANSTALPYTSFGGENLTSNNGKDFLLGDVSFQLDGQYVCEFAITINGITYTKDNLSQFTVVDNKPFDANTVTVNWAQPELKITAVTNATKNSTSNTTFSVNLANDSDLWSDVVLGGVQNYFEPYYANVYIMGERGSYSAPSVTMQLENAGNTDPVNITVGGSDYSTTYNFAGNGNCVRNIGLVEEVGIGLYNRHRAGTTTVKSLNLSYDGVTYTFTLANPVTIKQDANPIYLKYVVSEDSSKAPAVVISPDGRAMTVTLADIADWTSSAEETVTLEETVKVAAATVRTDYKKTSRSGSLLSGGYTYKYAYYYYQQRTVTRGTGLKTTITNYTLNGWTVDGGLKNVGDSVTITAAKTATASIGTSSTFSVVPADTYDVVQETHVAGPTNQSSTPSGGQEISSEWMWIGISIINGWQDT